MHRQPGRVAWRVGMTALTVIETATRLGIAHVGSGYDNAFVSAITAAKARRIPALIPAVTRVDDGEFAEPSP